MGELHLEIYVERLKRECAAPAPAPPTPKTLPTQKTLPRPCMAGRGVGYEGVLIGRQSFTVRGVTQSHCPQCQ
jgi:hypothetical protein